MFDSREFVFEGKILCGFWLPRWIQQQNLLRSLRIANQVQKELVTTFKSEVQDRFPLAQAKAAVERYQQNMT